MESNEKKIDEGKAAETRSLNFLETIIEEDINNKKHGGGFIPDFLLNQMVICISVMRNQFV